MGGFLVRCNKIYSVASFIGSLYTRGHANNLSAMLAKIPTL